MAAINFGYTISKPRAIDIDRNNLRKSDEILREMPELQACIGCGACTGGLYGATLRNSTSARYIRWCGAANTRGLTRR